MPDETTILRFRHLLEKHDIGAQIKSTAIGKLVNGIETLKARVRAKVEHPFRVIKRQFGHVKVRYCGLAKNTAQLYTLFALSNLWMVRGQLLPAKG